MSGGARYTSCRGPATHGRAVVSIPAVCGLTISLGARSHVRPHDPLATRAKLVALAAGAVLARRLRRDHVLGPDERLHAALSADAGHRGARCGAVDRHRRLGLERGRAAVSAVLGRAG